MVNPEDIAERFWSLVQQPSEEARREQLFLEDVIHKAYFEREFAARLEATLGTRVSIVSLNAGAARLSA